MGQVTQNWKIRKDEIQNSTFDSIAYVMELHQFNNK